MKKSTENRRLKAIFITGTSGTGKSTLAEELQKLASDGVRVLDMDKIGHVPKDADTEWRIKKTAKVIEFVNENAENGFSSIVCGVCVPKEIKLYEISKSLDITFGLLEIPPDTIRKRLAERKWTQQLIDDNVIWAEHLKRFVEAEPGHFIINSEDNTPEQIAKMIVGLFK